MDSTHDRERELHYRQAHVYDCWGVRRSVSRFRRSGLWHLNVSGVATPERDEPSLDRSERRRQMLSAFERSGLFTQTQLDTIRALALEGQTLCEITERFGCSRQAIVSRITGNSTGQGGILRKVARLIGSLPDPLGCEP